MPYEIVIGDISNLKFKVDVIVTMACPEPEKLGNGVNRAIFESAGEKMREDRLRKKSAYGKMFMAPAHKLNASKLIHTFAPYYINGKQNESEMLEKCYLEAMNLAHKSGYRSIAFPLISSGNNGFPIEHSYRIAVHSFIKFCEAQPDMYVYLIIFDEDTISYCRTQHMSIRTDEQIQSAKNGKQEEWLYPDAFKQKEACEYLQTRQEMYNEIRRLTKADTWLAEDIDDILEDTAGLNAYETVCKLMDFTTEKFERTEREICESVRIHPTDFANHFRKQRKSPPKKDRLLAYAIAFKLTLNETKELLNRAGYTLQQHLLLDGVVMKYIGQRKYDIDAINSELDNLGIVTLQAKVRKGKEKKSNCRKACDNKTMDLSYNDKHAERLPGEEKNRCGKKK